MTALTKIKIKITALNIAFEVVVNSIVLFVGYMADKLILTLLFYLPFHLLRYAVPKVYHARKNKPLVNLVKCIFYSGLCYFISIKLMLPIGVSIFSSVLAGIGINLTLYAIQDYSDLKTEQSKQAINIYSMTEDELRAYAKSRGLSEMIIDTLVLRVVHNYRWVDIQNERNYSREGIKYHKKRICELLNVKI